MQITSGTLINGLAFTNHEITSEIERREWMTDWCGEKQICRILGQWEKEEDHWMDWWSILWDGQWPMTFKRKDWMSLLNSVWIHWEQVGIFVWNESHIAGSFGDLYLNFLFKKKEKVTFTTCGQILDLVVVFERLAAMIFLPLMTDDILSLGASRDVVWRIESSTWGFAQLKV